VAAALGASALLLVLAFGGGGARGAAGARAPRAAGEPPINVLLVTLDAAGADRLSGFGAPRPEAPTPDRLDARGTRFANAFSPSPRSVPALASMFTGQYPSFHSVGVSGAVPLRPETSTLAEILAGAGYRAAAVLGERSLPRRLGLDQGFATDIATAGADHPEGDAAATVAAARSLLAAAETPWFLWLHLDDPPGGGDAAIDEPRRWLDGLVAAGRLDRTLVIVAAVPGDSVGEADPPAAGGDSAALGRVRVPLLLAGPGVLPGEVIEPPVSTAAVFATVLDAAGLASRADRLRPRPVPSLLPLAARRRSGAPPAYVESATEIGVARGVAYLRRERRPAAGVPARRPPGRELTPLTGSRVPVVVDRELTALLDAFERRAAAPGFGSQRAEP
jgi:hypothetical protein